MPTLETKPSRESAPAHLRRTAGLLAAIVAISGLHYLTDPYHVVWHGVYQRLYYAPVILGAYWYGVPGGLLAALVTSLAYIPHIETMWSTNAPYSASQYAEVVMFYLAGLFVGLLADRQRRLTAQFQRAAASLDQANRDLRESQEQLLRADRLSALGEMAAGLAHEIRNPLASVRGAFEIIAARVQKGTPEAEFTEIGTKELMRLDELLKQFLAYARPRPPALRRTSLDDVVGHVAALLGPEAERRGVTVEVDRTRPVPEVLVDPEQIEQVFLNVLLNGIQASPRGGRVRIRYGREARRVLVEVVDEGQGIPAEHLSRVFDPFFTTKDKGTGLGLAVSARIVAAHGGEIEARRNDDRGTCIQIRLPRSTETAGIQAAPAPSRPNP